MKILALTATIGVAAMLAGCNKTTTTAAPGVIDTPGCCSSSGDSAACNTKKAASCQTKAASCQTKAACCSSKMTKMTK
jgi:hypothetical protein